MTGRNVSVTNGADKRSVGVFASTMTRMHRYPDRGPARFRHRRLRPGGPGLPRHRLALPDQRRLGLPRRRPPRHHHRRGGVEGGGAGHRPGRLPRRREDRPARQVHAAADREDASRAQRPVTGWSGRSSDRPALRPRPTEIRPDLKTGRSIACLPTRSASSASSSSSSSARSGRSTSGVLGFVATFLVGYFVVGEAPREMYLGLSGRSLRPADRRDLSLRHRHDERHRGAGGGGIGAARRRAARVAPVGGVRRRRAAGDGGRARVGGRGAARAALDAAGRAMRDRSPDDRPDGRARRRRRQLLAAERPRRARAPGGDEPRPRDVDGDAVLRQPRLQPRAGGDHLRRVRRPAAARRRDCATPSNLENLRNLAGVSIRFARIVAIAGVAVARARASVSPIGFVAFVAGAVLQLAFPSPSDGVEKRIAWGVVMLVCGVVTYVAALQRYGTVTAVGDAIATHRQSAGRPRCSSARSAPSRRRSRRAPASSAR